MKKTLTLAICAGILSPFYASAQLISLGAEGATTIDGLVAAMNADVTELYSPYSPGGDGGLSTQLGGTIYWDATYGWGISPDDAGAAANPNSYAWEFNELAINPDVPAFITGEFEVGYIGNESADDNMFLVGADLGQVTDWEILWDYDANDEDFGNLTPDDPPQSYRVYLDDPNVQPGITFYHMNQTQDGPSMVNHSDESRFKFWEMSEGDITYWLIAISDRDNINDGDADDGFFLVKFSEGGLPPVPEPSQIAAMALLGMGALLFIRRRFAKK